MFQPTREIGTGRIVGMQGFMRSQSHSDDGLSVWKTYAHPAEVRPSATIPDDSPPAP
ncbi:MAG TPA: hypothetical protein VI140_07165 [Oxalicibacterium sp.]